ncbi:unnamed protein product [Rhizoctonia solani]|uniref:Uncharacterized protein n=1 Tax=Rhizoctonia solani TaxID=456999 RepID=A0A8H3I2X9_9AGAM|nr:unnamed protein product [Rhizoctonia solani]
MDLIDKGTRIAKEYNQCLQDIADEEQPSRPLNKLEKQGLKEFLSALGEVKKTSKGSVQSVKDWKRVGRAGAQGRRGGKRGRGSKPDKPRKNGNHEEEPDDNGDDDEEEEVEPQIGAPNMKDQLEAAVSGTPLLIRTWYKAISQANAKNMSIDAAQGLLSIAPGIESGSDDEMTDALMDVLTDNLERQVLDAFDNQAIDEIQPSDLHRYFKESRNKTGPLNKLPRVALLQHIVSSIETLKCMLAWNQLEKGRNGKAGVMEQMYEAKCEEEDNVENFASFEKSVRTYHTGCNRFLDAYAELGSVLLLCPRLRLARFADTRLGPKLLEAVGWIAVSAEEFTARENVHREILEYAVIIMEGGESDSKLLKALKDIDNAIEVM